MHKNCKLTDFLETFNKEAFLQSEVWRKFQESEGKKTHHFQDFSNDKKGETVFRIWANIIEHNLPIVGKYLYIPRGPVIRGQKDVNLIRVDDMKKALGFLFWLAKDNGAGWIRFDSRSGKDLNLIKEAVAKISKEKSIKIKKAPHNMQPEEIFVIDISRSEEELLAEMKSKTRYNIRLAQKKGVRVFAMNKKQETSDKKIPNSFYLEEFLRLNRETAKRDGIVTHSDSHYRKMVENIPDDVLQIYVAKYQDKIIAANLVIFFGDTAIYLHGASSNEHRDAMAPYLLQWKQMLDAKERGYKYYDMGGVKTAISHKPSAVGGNSWEGITRFKTGFSPKTESIVFPGSYDIVIRRWKYRMYRGLRRIKSMMGKI